MKILIPSNITQNIVIKPRFYPSSDVVLTLLNEATNESYILDNTYITLNGVTTITFDFNTSEGNRYQVEVLEGVHVVYKGKAFSTDQNTQDYELTKGRYTY